MKRSVLLIMVICAVALRAPGAGWAHGRPPVPVGEGTELPSGDGPTATPPVASMTVLHDSAVYPSPTTDAPPIGTVRRGDVVRVKEQVGDWARIAGTQRALGGPVMPLADGWVAGTILDAGPTPPAGPSAAPVMTLTPGTTATPAATPISAWPAAGSTPPAGTVPPTAPVVDAPAPPPAPIQPPVGGTSTNATGPTVRVVALPAARSSTTPSQPLIPVQLRIPIYYDRNGNKFPDIDEGVAGLTVYVTDSGGQILGQTLTDATGVAQVTIRAPATAQLNMSVPYLGASQSVPATNPRTQPIRVPALAAFPALVP